MAYGIQVSRTVNGVTRTSLDPQALGGRVFVSVETAAAGVSRTITYDNVLGGSNLKYYFLNAGSHAVTTSTEPGTGKAQLNITAYSVRRPAQTQVIVFTTSTVEPSSGILTTNDSGERTVSAVLPVPVFLGKLTMPSTPDYSQYITEGGGYADTYSATTSLGAGTDRLVLWTIPENGSNIYFTGDSYIPAAVTGNAIVYGTVYSTAPGTTYTVGEALVFSLSYVPSSASTHGMRLFNSSGSLLFDSGNDHLYIKGFSSIQFSSTDTEIVNDSPDIYTGSQPAILIPNYYQEVGTRISNKLMSNIKTYIGAVRRQGTSIYTKRILAESYNEDFAVTNYSYIYGSQYNTIFGINAASLGAGSGTTGGTTLNAYIQPSGTETTSCVYDSNTTSACTINQVYSVTTTGGNGNSLSYYWYLINQSHPGTFTISGSNSGQSATVSTTSGDTAGPITARLICEVSQSGSTTVEAVYDISRVHQGYGELISITPSTLGWNSTGTISVKGTPNTSFTYQITNTSSQPSVFNGGPLALDDNGNFINLSSKGYDFGAPAGLKYLWVKFSETNNVKYATVTTTAVGPTINYFRVKSPGGSYSTSATGAHGSTPYFEWQTTDATSVSITDVSSTSLTASEIQGPTLYKTRTFTLTATHTSGGSSTASVTYTVTAPTITLSPATLPATKVNNSYNQTITASGGRASYSFSYTGTIPPGLSLSSSGTLSGTPSSQGTYNFTIIATDADSYTGSRSYTIQVDPANVIPTISYFDISLFSPESYGSSVSGGYGTTPKFRWSVTNASSISIAATGTVSGTNPYTTSSLSGNGAPILGAINNYGTTTITLTATSSTGDTASATVYFYGPSGPTISVSPTSLPNEYISRSYNQTISASGGTSPYTFAVISGTLPTGLSLGSSGNITGTTSGTGTFYFTIQATDASGYTGSQAYSVTISAAPTVTLSPSSLPSGTVGTYYSQTISASGGQGPHSFSVSSGSIPSGLSLGVGGVLSGTPNTAGTYNFTVTAMSGDAFSGSQFYSVTINSAVVYNETFTNSTSTPTANVPFNITVSGGVPNTIARYRLGLGGAEQQVTLNSSGSYTWSNLSLSAGTYTWYFSFDGSGNDRSHTVTVAAAPAPSGIVNPLGFNGGIYSSEYTSNANIAMYVHADGIWRIHDDTAVIADGNWYSPTTGSIGNNYWIRFTRNSASGTYGGSEPTTAWQQLSTVRSVYVNAYSFSTIDRVYTANYTVQISTDSSGTNIVSSSTVTLRAIALGSGGIQN